MTARVRKAIGGVGILAFLGAYIWLAATIGPLVPDQWFLRLVFYAVAGVGWGVPLIPLILWMNRGR